MRVILVLFIAWATTGCKNDKKSEDDKLQASKIRATQLQVRQFLSETYTIWSVETGEVCPGDIAVLAEYTRAKEMKDAWGNPLIMLCGDNSPLAKKGFAVHSAGPDGKPGTDDDIRSW